MEKEKNERLIYKEVTDVGRVNFMIKTGWRMRSVRKEFGKYIFMLIKE